MHFILHLLIVSHSFLSRFKALFACSSDIIVDLPKFWEFVAEIIAYTLVGVHELNTPKSKDVFKFISRAFGEVTGSDYSKLTKSLTDNLFSNVSSIRLCSHCELHKATLPSSLF